MTIRMFVLAVGFGLALWSGRANAQTPRSTPPLGAERRDEGAPRNVAPPRPRSRPDDERGEARRDEPRGPQTGGPPGRGPGSSGPAPGNPGGERGPGPRGIPEGGFGPNRPGGPTGMPGRMPGMPGMRPPGMGPFPPDMETLRENDPDMYKLEVADREMERHTAELSGQFRNAPKERREALRKELEETINKHFEVRQQRRLLQLSRLEKELQRMRDEIERRNERRDEIVGKRITELVGDKGDLDF